MDEAEEGVCVYVPSQEERSYKTEDGWGWSVVSPAYTGGPPASAPERVVRQLPSAVWVPGRERSVKLTTHTVYNGKSCESWMPILPDDAIQLGLALVKAALEIKRKQSE